MPPRADFVRGGLSLARKDRNTARHDESLLQVVSGEEGLTELPIITHMDFGHTDPMFVMPCEVLAEIDCIARQFAILESAVEG
jgi:muramoyltetrapeptide carboxypeptidase LdcA involved in peptidoglycan recycling